MSSKQATNPWDITKAALDRELAAAAKSGAWTALFAASAGLDRFKDPAAFVAFVGDREHSRDEENAALVELVRAAQGGSRVAYTALCIALWRGLSAIRGRWLRSSRGRDAELAADIGTAFVLCVGGLALSKTRRVAATLCRNTARDLARDRRRARASPDDPIGWPRRRPREDEELVEVRESLERECGRDGELMVRVIVDAEPTADVARAMGIPAATARQRVRRMTNRLRRALAA